MPQIVPLQPSAQEFLPSLRAEPDPAEMAERYGAETSVPEWRDRLVCSECGSRNIDMVVTGTERR